jgi:elongation factor Ts
MTITASLVKQLRDITNAGMMECKKALEATEGNLEAAVEHMRKSGMAKAAKKAGRTAAEGAIAIQLSSNQKTACMVEGNCETDFVARDQHLLQFVQTIAERVLASQVNDIDSLLALPYQTGSEKTIEQVRQELVAKLGENIQVRRFIRMESSGIVGFYKHGDRIGVLVQLDVPNAELGKDIAMHIAATNPQALSPEDIAPELVAKEREIFVAQASNSGKPAAIVEKMVDGQVKKFLNENSLLSQPFVKNPEETVADLLKAANAKVLTFVRYEVGEGIEKEVKDFAQEVMAQVRGG